MTLALLPSEVLLDPCRTWCPSSTCQAVCQLKEADSPALPQLVQCAVCALEFCSACKANWHPGQACQENNLPITSFLPGENRYLLFVCSFLYDRKLWYISNGCSLNFDLLIYSYISDPRNVQYVRVFLKNRDDLNVKNRYLMLCCGYIMLQRYRF